MLMAFPLAYLEKKEKNFSEGIDRGLAVCYNGYVEP
jgi:hypothetical protein|tara:strand:- start:1035 stop:1142 length:108 start_codon:yes stop_codon:yes gene_type:complete